MHILTLNHTLFMSHLFFVQSFDIYPFPWQLKSLLTSLNTISQLVAFSLTGVASHAPAYLETPWIHDLHHTTIIACRATANTITPLSMAATSSITSMSTWWSSHSTTSWKTSIIPVKEDNLSSYLQQILLYHHKDTAEMVVFTRKRQNLKYPTNLVPGDIRCRYIIPNIDIET